MIIKKKIKQYKNKNQKIKQYKNKNQKKIKINYLEKCFKGLLILCNKLSNKDNIIKELH